MPAPPRPRGRPQGFDPASAPRPAPAPRARAPWSRRGTRSFARIARAAAAAAVLVAALTARAAPPAEETVETVGPLRITTSGRDQVRGGRPEGATIHEAHVPRPSDPESAARADLEAFERQRLTSTAVFREPPEPWMAALAAPDLPLRWSDQTVEYIRYFRDDPKGQALLRGWFRRMGRYEPSLRAILREVGVPEDLVFVAMAESGFNPKRRSRVGAAGMWQFMEGTGRVYGLERTYWVDERLDIERATYAAAAYLKDLRARFGSWEMALAAFNGGYGLAMTAIGRHNTNNFWALCEIESGLPQATTHYVPKIVAAALAGRNRRAFGVEGPGLGAMPALEWAEVMVPPATAIATVAKIIGEDPALLDELNARYVRGRTPPEPGSYPVRVPRAKKVALQSSLGRLQSEADAGATYVVAYGDTLADIARRAGVGEPALRKLNGLDDNAELARGVVLLLPRRGGAPDGKGERPPRPIAAVPPLTLGPGQRLVFFEATRATTPRGLSDALGAPWESIVAWNDLDPQARIQPGQILQVVVPADFSASAAGVRVYEKGEVDHVIRGSAEHIELGLARRGLVRRAYRARAGDTLIKIGKKFDLSDGDLARINAIPRSHQPAAGDLIIVYVAEGKQKGTVPAPPPRAGLPQDAPPPPLEVVEAELAAEPPAELPPDPSPVADDGRAADALPPTPADATASTPDTTKLPGKQGWKRRSSAAKGKDRGKDRGKPRARDRGKAPSP